jgi:hypothetical protein
MKRAEVAALDTASTAALPWALLVAEFGAVVALFSFDLVPAVLVRSLQFFLRF